jgi:hypothetical protein
VFATIRIQSTLNDTNHFWAVRRHGNPIPISAAVRRCIPEAIASGASSEIESPGWLSPNAEQSDSLGDTDGSSPISREEPIPTPWGPEPFPGGPAPGGGLGGLGPGLGAAGILLLNPTSCGTHDELTIDDVPHTLVDCDKIYDRDCESCRSMPSRTPAQRNAKRLCWERAFAAYASCRASASDNPARINQPWK